MSEADGGSPSEETSCTALAEEPSAPQATKAKQNGKKVRTTKRAAKPNAAEVDTEAKELPAVVTAADAVPAEAASTPEAAAPVKEAPAPANGKAKGSAEDAGKVAAADLEETEQTGEDVSTSAEGDKDETEDSLVESARRGDLNKVSTSAEGDKDETEDSLVESARRGDLNKVHTSAEGEEKSLLEAVRGGDLNKVKELLADRGCDPHSLSNAWVSGQETFANRSRAGLGKNRRFISGTRPLIAAAALGHSHVVWELLVSRADVNATDSDGLTALSAAFCSPDCNIHTWFLLHHAADQTFKKSDQSSDAQADIQNDDDWTLLLGNMNARTDEKRALCMLVTLLRGEGQIFTDMVAGLLKEVEPGRYRSERLKERMRTVLCDYALDRQKVQKFLEDRGRAPRKSMYVLADDRAKKPEDVDAFNLSWHNMLYAPEVQVSLRSLPIAAPLACEPSVLAALAETENDETLQTDTVEAIAAAAWLQMRVATAVDSFLNCVALGCLCLVTWACRKEDMDAQPALWVLAMIQFKEGVEFLSQLGFYCWSCLSCRRVDMEIAIAVRRRIFRHVPVNGKEMKLLSDEDVSFVQHPAPSLETLADFFFLVAGFFAIYGQMDRCSDGELEPIFLPGLCSMYWLRLLYSLRGERWLGPYLLPILSAVRDTGAFFFVTSLCVASATHAYVIMNPRGDDDFPVYSAFTHTVRLAIFGDFDLFEYQGQDTTFEQVEGEWAPNDPSPKDLEQLPYIYLQLCFFCTGIGITVLLMNLLIAILSQNYEMQQCRAQGLFVQARARMLLEVQLRPWTRVGAWLGGKLFDPEVRGPPPLCLHLVTLAEIALRPLKVVMEPFVPEAYYQKNVFERFLQRALWSPVAKQNFLAVGIPVACVVLLAGSLVSLLAFLVIILVLKVVGFQLTGIRYTLNLSLFGLFGDRFADECEIFALVRTEAASDDFRSVRNDLKEKMQNLHEEQKARMNKLEDKIDRVLQRLSKASADATGTG